MYKIDDKVKLKTGEEVIIVGFDKPLDIKHDAIKYYFKFVKDQDLCSWAYEGAFEGNFRNEEIIEQECDDLAVKLWNKFNTLSPQHPDELIDFKNAIHQIQYILMARETRRNNPEKYLIRKEE